jgi:DNA-binding protein H-NS
MVESEDEEDQDEMVESEDEEDQDEMVDVDISELMSEIRRAKKIIKENKSRKQQQVSKKRRVQENALKRTIAKEVESILAEMEEHDSSWVYGTKKPKHSKAGYTNQGRTIPGLGFRKY